MHDASSLGSLMQLIPFYQTDDEHGLANAHLVSEYGRLGREHAYQPVRWQHVLFSSKGRFPAVR